MKFSNLKGDVFGGITAGIVALPLALAFGVQSGLGAIAGLYGAIILGFFASLLGGTATQVSGPTGPMTVVSALLVATFIQQFGGVEPALPYILMTFVLAGVFQIALGFAQVGQAVRYIPYPVVSGFMSGIGVIIILMQVFPFLGHASPKKIFDVFLVLHEKVSDANLYTVGLTVATIVLIYTLPKVIKTIPSALLALVGLTAVSTVAQLPVPVIGDIPTGLPTLEWQAFLSFKLQSLGIVLVPAITLAALGAIDSLLTSVVADNMTKTKHDSRKELIGQGIGNALSGAFGGIPGAGATMRTVININAGGQTRLSGMIHSVLLLVILLGLGQYAAQIPLAVLAGILITVGLSIIDYRGLKHLLHVPRMDAVILITVLLVTVFVNLLQAVAAGMILAAFSFMKKSSDLAEQEAKLAPFEEFAKDLSWPDEKSLPESLVQQVYIKHLNGPLFFGFVSHFKAMLDAVPNVRYVIVRMKLVPYIDQSGLYALEDAILYLNSKGIEVLLSGIQSQPKDMLQSIDLIPELVPEENAFEDFQTCIDSLIHRQK